LPFKASADRPTPPYSEAAVPGGELGRVRCRPTQRGSLTVWCTDAAIVAWGGDTRRIVSADTGNTLGLIDDDLPRQRQVGLPRPVDPSSAGRLTSGDPSSWR
jgi:hypothetical protein